MGVGTPRFPHLVDNLHPRGAGRHGGQSATFSRTAAINSALLAGPRCRRRNSARQRRKAVIEPPRAGDIGCPFVSTCKSEGRVGWESDDCAFDRGRIYWGIRVCLPIAIFVLCMLLGHVIYYNRKHRKRAKRPPCSAFLTHLMCQAVISITFLLNNHTICTYLSPAYLRRFPGPGGAGTRHIGDFIQIAGYSLVHKGGSPPFECCWPGGL